MANRPVFFPITNGDFPGVVVRDMSFEWFAGMAKSQKQKSIASLHDAVAKQDLGQCLEVSSKSTDPVGNELSAFMLTITTRRMGTTFTVENAFQSSKVFEFGGPYSDLLSVSPLDAKKDPRLVESGALINFSFFGQQFSANPKTHFYDWLYINALKQNTALAEKSSLFQGFTDIEFNPNRSLNCQANALALFHSLRSFKQLDDALESPEAFLKVCENHYEKYTEERDGQSSLF